MEMVLPFFALPQMISTILKKSMGRFVPLQEDIEPCILMGHTPIAAHLNTKPLT